MTQTQRQYDFSPGTKALSSQVDDEFNNLVQAHNTLDTDVQTHKTTQVDPASTDTNRDKHVSNNDLKNLQDQINSKTSNIGNHQGTWQGLNPNDLESGQQALNLQAIENDLATHEADSVSHVTQADKDKWNAIDIAKFKKGNSTFTDNDTSQTFTDAFCTVNSLVTIVITSVTPPKGVWSVDSAAGSFTITSTVAEDNDITFDYYIQKAVG